MKLLTAQEEQELVARLAARDEKALAYFYQNYKGSMLYTVQRLVRHKELAEDIVQEGIIKFWFAFPSYDPKKGRLYTWFINICRNLAIDHLRLQRRAQEATIPLSDEITALAAASPSFKPEHVGVREWLDLIVIADRGLIRLLYLNGLTHQEAADQLQLPLGTVKSRSRRLIQQLSVRLGGAEQPAKPVN